MLARIVRRWLFILLAVVLSGWFSPTVALARSLRSIPHYDAVVAMEKVVLGGGITMDTFEGNQSDPLSLHKYLYCASNPVNQIDPSGQFMEGVGGLLNTASLQMGLRGLQGSVLTFPGRIAARGFMKWAWLAGGIGAGVQALMQDTPFAMDMQLTMQSNPTESQWAYQNLKCVEFADDAMTFFRTKGRGKQPQWITYRSRSRRTVGDNIIAANDFGFFKGKNISSSGFHKGVLVDGRVYDNNVPFGVSRTAWENGYLVTAFPEFQEMTIGYAAKPEVGVGDITTK
jgi:hypothetical protein